MNTVLLPNYFRPEMLYYCLNQIKKAEGAEKNHYVFQLDYGFNHMLLNIIRGFPYSHEIRIQKRVKIHRDAKQSYNLLEGYMYCAEKSSGLVFMIEDDVMISNDFFVLHETIHKMLPDIFCSIAVENPNRKLNFEKKEPSMIYITSGDYCSLGVCFSKNIIKKMIVPHCNSNYFNAPSDYIRQTFPRSEISGAYSEQDGLIRRIQTESGRAIVYPVVPRAYHAGYYGKNRKKYISGSLASKIKTVGEIIFNDQAMRSAAMIPEYYEDSKPINLNIGEYDYIQIVDVL